MRLWEITYWRTHGGMTIGEETVQLWLDADDEDNARDEARRELPRRSIVNDVHEIGNG